MRTMTDIPGYRTTSENTTPGDNVHKTIAALLMSFFIALNWGASTQALERFEIITTQELQQLIEQRKAGNQDFLLINALDEIIYGYNAIPGSISLPWSRVEELSNRLGTDREKLIITYCMGYR